MMKNHFWFILLALAALCWPFGSMAHEIRPGMKRIVLSGYTHEAFTRNCESAGADLFMAMPFRRDAFLGNLETILGEPGHRMTIDLGN